MPELEGIYTIWLREMKRFFMVQVKDSDVGCDTLLWLIIFGTGLGAAVRFGGVSGGYRAFIYPGIISQNHTLHPNILGGSR